MAAYDLAGIDGSFAETWSDYSPDLPRPDGSATYDYRRLWTHAGRYYCAFGSRDGVTWGVYVYSWAVGEVAWTQEFASFDYDLVSWDAAYDGTKFYVAYTKQGSEDVDCGGGIHVAGNYSYVAVFSGVLAGSWALMRVVLPRTFNLSEGISLSLCADSSDPGNCYLAASEGGVYPCNPFPVEQAFWVIGIGPSPRVGVFNPISGYYDRVFVEYGLYTPALLTGPTPLARVNDLQIFDDGDDVQVICRLPEDDGGPHAGFNSVTVSVFKPETMQTDSRGMPYEINGLPGFEFWYELPTFTFDTVFTDPVVASPCWTETGGRRQRAIISIYSGGTGADTDVRGLDANGIQLHHLHDNTRLDSTAITTIGSADAGVGESLANQSNYYRPGFFYDPDGDEYWVIYQNPGHFRSSVTGTCGTQRWIGWPFHAPGVSGTLQMAQGPFDGDAFYAVAVPTTVPASQARVIKIPISRDGGTCPAAPVFATPHPWKAVR